MQIFQWVEQKHKKISAVLAFLLVLFLLVPARSALSQSSTVLSIHPGSTDVNLGQTVTVDVYISGGVDVNAFDVGISYDPAVVSLESYATGGYLSNLAKVYEESGTGSKRLVYTQLATAGANGDGTLLSLTFKGLQAGSSAVSFNFAALSNSASESISLSTENGIINVISVPTGTATATATSPSPATSTATATATATATSTATVTRTPTKTFTPTQTRTPINTSVVVNRTATPTVTQRATGTTRPTNTSSAFLTLTPLPVPLTGEESPTPQMGAETQNGPANPTLTAMIPGTGEELTGGWWSQLICIFTILLFIALIVLLSILLRRRKKDAPTTGN